MSIKNKKCICFIFDFNYINQGKYAIQSAKKNNPDHSIVLLIDNTSVCDLADIQISPQDIGLNKEHWLIIGRIAIVEYALEVLGFETAIFVDGDTYTYNNYNSLQLAVDNHSLVVIPHITKPLPNDNKFPQNRIISLSGNYNTGVWAASKSGLNFIKWWKDQTSLFPITRPDAGLVNEQGWLRFAGDFDDSVKIFRHPGYNVAYWNIKQRTLQLQNNQYYIDNEPLSIVHFSGLKKELNPSQMSVFQNRYYLEKTDLAYTLFNDYHKLVWSDSLLENK
jgi:hypothetical protein